MKTPENPSIDWLDQLLFENKLLEVVRFVNTVKDPPAEMLSRQGLAYYRLENYEESSRCFQVILTVKPEDKEIRELYERSKVNARTRINEFVPEVYHFDEQVIQKLRRTTPLPVPVKVHRAPGGWRFSRKLIGDLSGRLLSVLIDNVTVVWGRLAGFHDQIWTNWYRRPAFLGILTLAYMRERMHKYNLYSAYPANALVGFVHGNIKPPVGVTHFRTADGSWNNLHNPLEGAVGTRFLRNIAPNSIQTEDSDRLLYPNPRKLSRIFLTRGQSMKEVPFLNMLAVAWIQFQNHDWISHGEPRLKEYYEIPLDKDDPARLRYRQLKMFVGKTQNDYTRCKDDQIPITHLNECTHWWDGSQIYGSDLDTQQRLRSGISGKLVIQDNGLLPRDKKGIEITGFTRNWWVGLAMMHTLFVKEHNAICDDLTKHYPEWDDERLFQVARLINAAVMAKIHSLEWNSVINPNATLAKGLQSNWYGMLTTKFHPEGNRKTVAGINVRNPEMGGVVGNPIEKHGSPYGLTQEFVEVYRLHSMLPETLIFRDHNGDVLESIRIDESRQRGSGLLTDRLDMGQLWHSFGLQHPGQLVLNNYPRFMQEMSIPGNPVYDLGAVDILRSRERGVPRYNAFRRALGLQPIETFADLTDDEEVVRRLDEAYGGNVELLDLMIGSLAEGHRPKDFAFGETIFQIFLLNATRRLQADRFYTDCYTAEYYTPEGLEWIDRTDMKTVLLRHHPELIHTGLARVKNAFEPWHE
ncbi:MAG: hypothetical protein KDC28_03180 [Saprospiraceae bacterium]|nr:hypothetical protein [Saprospiraceae bacterium]MCB9318184.1 peroxidase [Lewinellaceae bacterium]